MMNGRILLVLAVCVATSQAKSTRVNLMGRILNLLRERKDGYSGLKPEYKTVKRAGPACVVGCAMCTNADTCMKCKPGYELKDNLCHGLECDDNAAIWGFNDKSITHVASEAACIDLCLTESEFSCRSIDYWASGSKCYLSIETKLTQPDAFRIDHETTTGIYSYCPMTEATGCAAYGNDLNLCETNGCYWETVDDYNMYAADNNAQGDDYWNLMNYADCVPITG